MCCTHFLQNEKIPVSATNPASSFGLLTNFNVIHVTRCVCAADAQHGDYKVTIKHHRNMDGAKRTWQGALVELIVNKMFP